ncbi:hypothetical protein JVU11DRAFT_2107 [Chiua virens]|nr:hypothetical protein JVU11DRAFT_2107 [Chiua virens]
MRSSCVYLHCLFACHCVRSPFQFELSTVRVYIKSTVQTKPSLYYICTPTLIHKSIYAPLCRSNSGKGSMQFEFDTHESLWESSIVTLSQFTGESDIDFENRQRPTRFRRRSAFARVARVLALFHQSKSESVGCLVCQEDFESRVCFCAPCGHYYCPDCTADMAKAAITEGNEELLPVQCCRKPFPLRKFLKVLPEPLRAPVAAKSKEMTVPLPLRLYCPNDTCSAFLGKSSGRKKVVSCPQCRTKMCSACKEVYHSPNPCGSLNSQMSRGLRSDRLTHEAMEFASGQGWKVCPGCDVIVERYSGCPHMRCRCGTRFCYQCGSKECCGCSYTF